MASKRRLQHRWWVKNLIFQLWNWYIHDMSNQACTVSNQKSLLQKRLKSLGKNHLAGFDPPLPHPDSPGSPWCRHCWLQGEKLSCESSPFSASATFNLSTFQLSNFQPLPIYSQVLNHKNQDIRPPAPSSTGGEVSTEQVPQKSLLKGFHLSFSNSIIVLYVFIVFRGNHDISIIFQTWIYIIFAFAKYFHNISKLS